MKQALLISASVVLFTVWLVGQDTRSGQEIQVREAEFSVPFGTTEGKVAVVGEFLIFIDDRRPEASFAISRGEIRNVRADNQTVTIETQTPMRVDTGQQTQLVFRLRNDGDAESISQWLRSSRSASQMPSVTSQADSAAGGSDIIATYQAKRSTRLWGGSRGRLIISQKGLAYEAIDKISDSRRWTFRDIKELELNNPYELKVTPFNGSDYTIELSGKGIDADEFRQLVNSVTSARVSRAE
ncbi:MAG: hypothetical protein EHM18_01330 [Acidobacteria bacterium]|nr:MAG: hypothetical protein EHM18_01330 [Acidobacteriota bacterium]